ncbi:hypothetical protein C2845_PM04G22170 [Panicum miliaceum]|uniref:RRM domain-containing protein n=1 Tax=Panicum miliaceum TaxID=4540 RepID=A0A3L6QV19_PANMI|nr:hypothetical protein C2845_PM04G22170 [Panicum miliaceum]
MCSSGACKGYGCIIFHHREHADDAIEALNCHELDERLKKKKKEEEEEEKKKKQQLPQMPSLNLETPHIGGGPNGVKSS